MFSFLRHGICSTDSIKFFGGNILCTVIHCVICFTVIIVLFFTFPSPFSRCLAKTIVVNEKGKWRGKGEEIVEREGGNDVRMRVGSIYYFCFICEFVHILFQRIL